MVKLLWFCALGSGSTLPHLIYTALGSGNISFTLRNAVTKIVLQAKTMTLKNSQQCTFQHSSHFGIYFTLHPQQNVHFRIHPSDRCRKEENI